MKEAEIKDILHSKEYAISVEKEINKIKKTRKKRPEKPGFHYVRDIVDRVKDDDNLNPIYFIKHIETVLNKTSKLNSQERNLILYICNEAFKNLNKKEDEKR